MFYIFEKGNKTPFKTEVIFSVKKLETSMGYVLR